MDMQTQPGYMVDNRYRGVKRAVDNTSSRNFLNRYIERHRQDQQPNYSQEAKEDGRFVVSGPGNNLYTFKNAYGSEQSPEQRRLAQLNQ
jgi:hypothetical protein